MRLLSILLFSILSLYTIAQDGTPRIKNIRTTTYEAVKNDTSWVTGAAVMNVHFQKFDYKGRVFVENSLKTDGSVNKKTMYTYDEDGRVSEELIFLGSQNLLDLFTYGYDEKNRLTEVLCLDSKREWKSAQRVVYNAAGKINRREQEYREDGTSTIDFIEYDATNIPIHVRTLYTSKVRTREVKRNVEKSDTLPLRRQSEGYIALPKGYTLPEEYINKPERNPGTKNVREKHQPVYTYDAFGNWVKRVDYGKDNTPEYIVLRLIEYDLPKNEWERIPLNDRVKSVYQTSFIADPRGPETILRGKKQGHFFRYRFNEKGCKTFEEQYSEEGVLSGSIGYEYDANDVLLKETHKSPVGGIIKSVVWNYWPDSGELRNKLWLDTQGEVVRKGVFYYDMERNINREIWYFKDATIASDVEYKYDSYGQQISAEVKVWTDGEAAYKALNRIYNFQGRVVEVFTVLQDGTQAHQKYKYNAKGEIVSGSEQNNGTHEEFVYKFFADPKGNWLKRIKFIGDVPVIYEEREFTYYNK